MDNGGSVPPGNDSQTQRSTIDQDVERAFDLLRHYQGFLCKPSGSLTDEQTTRAIDQLEGVMRKWLPRAGAAQDRLLDDVCAAIGDREKAARLLANVQLTPALNECMAKVALLVVPTNQTAQRATATCRRELQHWRTLLPPVRRGLDQLRYVDPDDRFASRAVGMYWSADLTSRPSRLGASLFLAAACDAVAAAARKQGMPVESLRPALRLAQRLRDNPEWTHVDAREVVQVIDEQVALAREVQDLLAEIDLGIEHPPPLSQSHELPEADDPKPSPAPSSPEGVLKFSRAPDAKQKCLETLARAPAGIPTHQDIADAAELGLQTVKEAMGLLKNAGFVEKVEGAWTITDQGRERLKVLRGE
jgi:hypothetical protein